MPIIIVVGEESELQTGKGRRALTITQVAARLGISEKSVRNLIARDLLTPYPEKVFNAAIFMEEDVEELREARLKRYY